MLKQNNCVFSCYFILYVLGRLIVESFIYVFFCVVFLFFKVVFRKVLVDINQYGVENFVPDSFLHATQETLGELLLS